MNSNWSGGKDASVSFSTNCAACPNPVIPSVTIAITAGTMPVCQGENLTFTATSVNGGSNPTYEWTVNVGGNSVVIGNLPTLTYNAFTVGGVPDIIKCKLTSNDACATSPEVLSNSLDIVTTYKPVWYLDADGDHYYTGSPIAACTSPGAGYTTSVIPGGDCDPDNSAVHPGATEVCSNGIDDNCNGFIDENNTTTPIGVIQGPAGVCRGAAGQVFSVAAVPGASSYQWILPIGATGSSVTNTISLNFSNTYNMGLIAVKAISSCNKTALSARQIQAYTSKPGQPRFIQGKNLGTCSGNEIYSIPAVGFATSYNWVAPANTSIVSGQGTTSIELSFTPGFVSGILSVTASNCVATSAARTLQLLTKPGAPAAIVGAASVCPGAAGVKYSTTSLAGVTYTWEVPTGATITNGQGTAAITVNWGTVAGTVKVSASNLCGPSANTNQAVSLLICTPPITMAQAEQVQADPVENKLEVKLWPNPARDVLMVTLDGFTPNQKIELMLMQADGKMQQAQSLMPAMNGQQVRFDVRALSAGYYLLQVKQGASVQVKKVVIIR